MDRSQIIPLFTIKIWYGVEVGIWSFLHRRVVDE